MAFKARSRFEDWFGTGDYGKHKLAFLLAVLGLGAGILFGHGWAGGVMMGIGLITSGFFAIRGGRSAVSVLEGDDTHHLLPEQKDAPMTSMTLAYAWLTGTFIILLGGVALTLSAKSGFEIIRREYRAATSGAVSSSLSPGQGLAVVDDWIVSGFRFGINYRKLDLSWGKAQTFNGQAPRVLAAKGAQLVLGSDGGVSRYFVRNGEFTSAAHVERASAAATPGAVTSMWNDSDNSDELDVPEDRHSDEVRALAFDGDHLAWLGGNSLTLWSTQTKEYRRWYLGSKDANTVTVKGERIWYGPTPSCGLTEVGVSDCVLPANVRPCGLAQHGQRLASVTDDDEVFVGEIDVNGARVVARRIAQSVQGCGIALDDRNVYVAGPKLAVRIDVHSGELARLYETQRLAPVQVGVLAAGRFYWRTESYVYGVYADADPL